MHARVRWLFAVAGLLTAAGAQTPPGGDPRIGYLYPAGGRQSAMLQVLAGGQGLRGVDAVRVSGGGITASIVEWCKPLGQKELGDIGWHLREEVKKRAAEAAGKTYEPPMVDPSEIPPLPDHFICRNIGTMSIKEMDDLRLKLYDPKKQLNPQIGEMVLLRLTIDKQAEPGDRELRLQTPNGLTNPLRFQVGTFKEYWEPETNIREVPTNPPLEAPVVINGQIMPGDVDRFRLKCVQGQTLVIEASARRLIPYLADAVPGWFQATMHLYDTKGKEIGYADDYGFDPDPVLIFKIPADGEYDLAIHDSIYRGREDFVYRIAIAERPFVTQIFPLGGKQGSNTVANLVGWNLPSPTAALDTMPGLGTIRFASLTAGRWRSNAIPYQVDTLAEIREEEPNDDPGKPQPIGVQRVVNGVISKPGDLDYYEFVGQGGSEIVAEVVARRLYSRLDSLLRLLDKDGQVLASNDDTEDKEFGLLTHHADSYLRFKLPATGLYRLLVSDAQRAGGEAYAYRLRLTPPRHDFAVRMCPSSINVMSGSSVPVTVQVIRDDGFDGEIMLNLKSAPEGFVLNGAWVPKGQDRVRMTVTAPRLKAGEPTPIVVEAKALIAGKLVTRPVTPAEDMMQAFAYRHLVPVREMLAAVSGYRRYAPAGSFVLDRPLAVPVGGEGQVLFKTASKVPLETVKLELKDPPAGLSLGEPETAEGGVAIRILADAAKAKVGDAGNLILEAFSESKAANGTVRRNSMGYLPALPMQVVVAPPPGDPGPSGQPGAPGAAGAPGLPGRPGAVGPAAPRPQ
ncbi:MAG: hypothetical protein IT204_16175 [Fimbriimonadaceae bacterium]|nr:hypothetical protein [Fimbriimonadaceae bacterium]